MLLVAGYRVGHSGGALVYTHGAASAYVDGATAVPKAGALVPADGSAAAKSTRSGGDDDDDRH
jgi:hypothetical protein